MFCCSFARFVNYASFASSVFPARSDISDIHQTMSSAETKTYCSKARCPSQVPTFQGLPFKNSWRLFQHLKAPASPVKPIKPICLAPSISATPEHHLV